MGGDPPPTTHRLPISSGSLGVLDWGGDGPDLLFLHPNGLCAGLFDPLAQRLRGRWRVVGIDLRGHGASDDARSPLDLRFDRLARDVVEALDLLGVDPPLAFTAIRFTIGTGLLWLILRRPEPEHDLAPGLGWTLVLLGVVGNTIYQLCFISGLAVTTAVNTSLILSAMPAVVTVTAGVLGLEVITGRQRWGLALATIGVVVVVASRGFDLRHGSWRGDLLILAAVGCWTGYTLGLRRISGRVSALGVTAWTMLTGTPGLVLAGLPQLSRTAWGAVPATAWGGLVYSTLLSLVAAYILWSRAVQRIGASRAALYTCVTPLFASLIAIRQVLRRASNMRSLR